MKISITINNVTYSVESKEDESDGTDLFETILHIKGLLVSAGFDPMNVDKYFSEVGRPWFTQCVKDSRSKEEIEEWQNNLYTPEKDADDIFSK